jgi:hypothetical protein
MGGIRLLRNKILRPSEIRSAAKHRLCAPSRPHQILSRSDWNSAKAQMRSWGFRKCHWPSTPSPTGDFDVSWMCKYTGWPLGVGTGGGLDTVTGGAFGEGIEGDIRQFYRLIVYNYQAGDEIYFFGFSRGAFTVRTLTCDRRPSSVKPNF